MPGPESDRDRETPNSRGRDSTVTEPPVVDPVPTDDADELLVRLLERWDQRFRLGDDATPECVDMDPALQEKLLAAVAAQRRLYGRLGIGTTSPEVGTNRPDVYPSLPDYEIIARIGRGGMGVVYQARDLKLGRVVAIKTIADGPGPTDERLARFGAEARAVARLRHPNIIAIHAVGELHDRPFLSLEFAEGGSLAQHLAEKPMSSRDAAALLETLAGAIDAAHHAGVIHRDLKPSNILFAANGTPKVSDFGLAKLVDGDSERTASGQVMGTPSYMSPEQAEGRSRHVGPAADVYALGAILYAALTGRPPFLGESTLETLKLVASAEVVAPHLLRPDIPRDLETVCLKCLEKEPLQRYASARALADDLRRFLDGRPITARPVGPAGRLWRWGRRNPRVAGLAVAVAASLIIGTVVSTVWAIRAIQAEAAARKQRDRAEVEAAIRAAVDDFVQKDLLSQASAYTQATLGVRPDPDLKIRTALDRAAEKIETRFHDRPLVEAAVRLTIGETYGQLGLYAQAQPHVERALELRRRVLGDEDPATFVAMHALGSLLEASGNLEAGSVLVPALDGLRRTRGPLDPETLSAMHHLAVYVANRDPVRAESLLNEAIAGFRIALGPEHLHTIEAMQALGDVYFQQNRLAEGQQLLERAVASLKQSVGDEHPSTLIVQTTLAAMYRALKKPEDAERLWTDVLRVQKRVLGEQHADTLATMVLLGAFLMNDRHRLDDAERLLLDAMRGCRQALDRNHLTTDVALASLSALYAQREDLKKMAAYLVEAAEVTRLIYGPDHGLTVAGTLSAGLGLLVQKEYARAEPYLREYLSWCNRAKAGGDLRFATEERLAACLIGQTRYGEAEPLLISAFWGMKALAKTGPRNREAVLRRVVEHIAALVKEAGQFQNKVAVERIRADPEFQAIALDLVFPVDRSVFAAP